MPCWPSLEEKRNRRTDRPAESGKRCRAAGGAWPPGPIETHLHRFFSWENSAPEARMGARGRSVNAEVSYQLNMFGCNRKSTDNLILSVAFYDNR